MPKARGTDDSFYPMAFNEKEKKHALTVSVRENKHFLSSRIHKVNEGICRSFGLSKVGGKEEAWSPITETEMVVGGLFETPRAYGRERKDFEKLVITPCENIYDPSRPGNSLPVSIQLEVVGGIIYMPSPGGWIK